MSALDRAISVFEAVVEATPEISLAAAAARTGLPKPTVHRILAVWARRGYVLARGHGRYAPGPRVLTAAGLVSGTPDYARLARASLRELKRHTDDTVHLAMLVGSEAVYIEKLDGNRPYRMASIVGMRLPLHSTAIGKAILAHSADSDRDAILATFLLAPRTARTITDGAAFRDELLAIRRRGWALDDEENEVGIRCVGAPVFDHRGDVVGAVSVSAPAFDFPLASVRQLAPALLATARSITVAFGGTDPRISSARRRPGYPVSQEGS